MKNAEKQNIYTSNFPETTHCQSTTCVKKYTKCTANLCQNDHIYNHLNKKKFPHGRRGSEDIQNSNLI